MFQLPPLFANVPIALVPSQQIAEFPVNTFLESIVVSSDGTLFVTSHFEGKIFRIGKNVEPTLHAAIAGKATGLAELPDGGLLLSGWDAQEKSVVFVFSPDGSLHKTIPFPDAQFLNGLTHLADDRYLIADSYRGAIWQLDVSDCSVEIWLEHPLLARSSAEKEFPGVNGLKIHNSTLYASNTEKTHLVRIPIQPDQQPGKPEIFVPGVNLDDFAFDPHGNLYATTHVFNSVVKISADGTITTVAQAEQGVTGSTALAFGRAVGDRTGIYVVTNGGMSLPPASGVEPAKVVRLEVNLEDRMV